VLKKNFHTGSAKNEKKCGKGFGMWERPENMFTGDVKIFWTKQ
jgi:hypothetical protein